MSSYVVDIEADGPIPGDFSMIEIGIVKLTEELKETLHLQIKPITMNWDPKVLAVTGYEREDVERFQYDAYEAMSMLKNWISVTNKKETRPIYFSDNIAFDWMFTHWYFIHFLNEDPFGWSGRNINDIFKGLSKNMRRNHKKLRDTKHTHNPVDDAKGNAEALLKMVNQFNLSGIQVS